MARLVTGLTAVVRIERAERRLPASFRPAAFWARERVVRRPEISQVVERLVPRSQRSGWADDEDSVHELTARLRADAVVMAKFDIHDRVKLRAAYGQEGLTLAVQPPHPSGLNGITRAVMAHEVVERHASGLMPALVAHGELSRGVPYLVERWLDGTALSSAAELDQAVPEILEGLSDVHRGHGLTRMPLSVESGIPLARQWGETLQTGIIPEKLGAWVTDLIERDHELRWSWSHGDMVASNVVRTPTQIVLVDWEHSGEAPIMRDGAKLHLYSAAPEHTLVLLLEAFGGDPAGSTMYTPAEELALCHAQMLARYPLRRRNLAGHDRAEIYERQVLRQVDRLAQVRAAAVA